MNECLTCHDLGHPDCSWVCYSEKRTDMVVEAKKHLRNVHGIKNIPTEMLKKIDQLFHK